MAIRTFDVDVSAMQGLGRARFFG